MFFSLPFRSYYSGTSAADYRRPSAVGDSRRRRSYSFAPEYRNCLRLFARATPSAEYDDRRSADRATFTAGAQACRRPTVPITTCPRFPISARRVRRTLGFVRSSRDVRQRAVYAPFANVRRHDEPITTGDRPEWKRIIIRFTARFSHHAFRPTPSLCFTYTRVGPPGGILRVVVYRFIYNYGRRLSSIPLHYSIFFVPGSISI